MSYDASNIVVLEGLEAVRVRPAMYIGSTTSKGLNHLVYEIVDNSVDEACNGYGDTVYVTLNADGSCTVKDRGRGIPVDLHQCGISALRVVLTTLHAGGKFDNSNYRTSGGLHGVGSSVVNALSEYFTVRVYRNGTIYEDSYRYGKPEYDLVDGLPKIAGTCPKGRTGTEITFKPDDSIFPDVRFKSEDIKSRLREIAYLNPNLTIKFTDNRIEPIDEVTFSEPNGIVQYLTDNFGSETSISDVYRFSGSKETDNGTVQADVAIQYVQSTQEKIVGFCNNILTAEGGSHVTAVKSTLTTLINQYAKELEYIKSGEPNFTGADIRSGFRCIISIRYNHPQFEGQTKTKLDNPEVGSAVSTICSKELSLYFDRNVHILNRILEVIKRCSNLRKKEARAHKNLFQNTKKYSFDSNGKLSNCESKDYSRNELFICEGDSAAGSGKLARDRKHQAILPIRGKILNTEKAAVDRILANEEIRTIIYALGCGFGEGYGNDFDISKLKYDKIIIMTDSDFDGAHITTLLMTLFYRLMPEIITTGHLYVAVSPLYKVFPVKGNPEYIYNDEDLKQYTSEHKVSHIQRYKGLGEMNPDQLWETTMSPDTRVLKRVMISDDIYTDRITSSLMGTDTGKRKELLLETTRNTIF